MKDYTISIAKPIILFLINLLQFEKRIKNRILLKINRTFWQQFASEVRLI